MKVIRLKGENIQKIKMIDITPTDGMFVVGGRNGQGKTTTLDLIKFALGGKPALPERPVRIGAEEGSILLETEDFIVSRVIHPTGETKVAVHGRDGLPFNSPQKLLTSFLSKLSLDPLEFSQLEAKKQIEIIKGLVPYDFTTNERKRKAKYDERTFVNRKVSDLEGQNKGQPYDPNFPIEEVVDNETQDLIHRATEIAMSRAALENNLANAKKAIGEASIEIGRLESLILAQKDRVRRAEAYIKENEPKLSLPELTPPNTEELKARQEKLAFQNEAIRANAVALNIFNALIAEKEKAQKLTEEINELDAEKLKAITDAKLPVQGLSFTEEGVFFGGIPFSQLSGAERLKVSTAMGIALNPTFKVLLIRDGSLLDDDNLKLLGQMAVQHGMQIWVERVGDGEEVSVVLEDGEVIEDRTKSSPQHAA